MNLDGRYLPLPNQIGPSPWYSARQHPPDVDHNHLVVWNDDGTQWRIVRVNLKAPNVSMAL